MFSHKSSNVFRLLKIGLVANILESYEFLVYVYLAGIMGSLFFNTQDPQTASMIAWAVFAFSYFVRPVGSLFWGRLGDRIGRGRTIQAALFTMAIPTLLIGLLPTYDQIGLWAGLGLLLLRCLQVFSAGGEVPVNGCYIFESTEGKQRTLLCSVVVASTVIGYLGASLTINFLFWYFKQAEIKAWAWRLPYLLSIPITFVIWQVRKVMLANEPPTLASTQPHTSSDRLLDWALIKSRLFPMMLLSAFPHILSYILYLWMPTYLVDYLQVEQTVAQLCVSFTLVIWASGCIIGGYLSYLLGYRRLIIISILLTIFSVPLFFKSLQSGAWQQLLLGCAVFMWLPGIACSTFMEMLARAFPRRVRAQGMSLSFVLSAVLFAGPTPLILSTLIKQTGWLMLPAFYIIFFGLLALPIAWRLKPYPERVEEA
jgi:MFS transporter, MHS family, proline/betaine transporter